jgi:hypothetical protein
MFLVSSSFGCRLDVTCKKVVGPPIGSLISADRRAIIRLHDVHQAKKTHTTSILCDFCAGFYGNCVCECCFVYEIRTNTFY